MLDDMDLEELFWQHTSKPDKNGCWLWTGKTKKRYGYLCIKSDGHHLFAHHYAYELFHGEIEKGFTIRHTCLVSRCVNPDHLYTEYRRKHVRTGVKVIRTGEDNNSAKLTESQVYEIKRLLSEHVMSQSDIARRYHVNRSRISYISLGKSWKHLQYP